MSNDGLILQAIIEAIDKVLKYSSEFDDAEKFYHDQKSFDACMMQFVVLAEMISKLTSEFKEDHSDIAWQKIKDFRNIIAHNYFGIDPDEIWDIIKNKIMPLKAQITSLL